MDAACEAIAKASVALQLLGVLWRLLGQLIAVDTLVVVMLRPKLLVRLHKLLASGAVTLSAALRGLGLTTSQLVPGEWLRPLFWQCAAADAPLTKGSLPSAIRHVVRQ